MFRPLLPLTAAWLIAGAVRADAMTSEELLRAFGSGFGKVHPAAAILSAVTLIGVLALMVGSEILRSSRRRREEVQIGWRFFEDLAAGKHLNPLEKETLREIVRSGRLSSADLVFESSVIYEEALEAYLEDMAFGKGKDSAWFSHLRALRYKLGYANLPRETPLCSTRQFEDGMAGSIEWMGGRAKATVERVDERGWSLRLEDGPEEMENGLEVSASLLRGGDAEYGLQIPVGAYRPQSRVVEFPHTRELTRRQMRNWVRIEVNIPARVTVAGPPAESADGERVLPLGILLEGRLSDLSGGGSCARLPSQIPKGHKVSLNFDLPGTSFRGILAEVIRTQDVWRGDREEVEHHLKFLSLETAQQEKIVRYVFEKQRLDSQLRGGEAGRV